MRNADEPTSVFSLRAWGRKPARFTDVVQSVFTSVLDWRRRRAAYRELAALDERMLKDIGIAHGDIASIVRGEFWRLKQRAEDRNE